MQRLTREEFLISAQQKRLWQHQVRQNKDETVKAQTIHQRLEELEWQLELDAIDEFCGYKMI